MKYTLGSLFDGSGGFPLAGSMCGITPLWAAEVEPYPIAVTRSRFPEMRHLGDISKINGAEIPPVDVITFGSPCQDLSVAGKRAGLKHEDNGDEETTRSGLFMEAVRIIKEMREATHGRYPSFALWENVPGAFSSNRGEDFCIVLEELIKIVEPCATVPPPPKGGWPYADAYMGAGWSLAYRVFDAQYWGVPQRRRRIHLVLDLRGERAREILFEREGVRGYFAEGRTPWQATARNAENCPGADDSAGAIGLDLYNFAVSGDVAVTLNANSGQSANHAGPTVAIKARTWDARGNGDGETVSTLTGDHENRVTDYTSVICLQGSMIGRTDKNGPQGDGVNEEAVFTLNTIDRHAVVYGVRSQPIVFDKETYNSGANTTGGHYIAEGGPCPTLRTEHPPSVCVRYIVRRLTPTECARLQGFADRWGDIEEKTDFTDEEYRFWLDVRNTHATINGKATKEYTKAQMLTWYNKLHTDSAEYKMWGNGIALPPALYCMQGIEDALEGGRRDG